MSALDRYCPRCAEEYAAAASSAEMLTKTGMDQEHDAEEDARIEAMEHAAGCDMTERFPVVKRPTPKPTMWCKRCAAWTDHRWADAACPELQPHATDTELEALSRRSAAEMRKWAAGDGYPPRKP